MNKPHIDSSRAYALPASHLLLALAIVAVWGTNFVVIKQCLADFPPFLFATLRYVFALIPLVFFVPRPKVAWANLCIYGLATGVGQFGVMYYAMNNQISPGLASLVIQTQVFFTIGFAMFFAKEGLKRYQAVAVAIALTGLVLIALHTDATTTFFGIALVVFSGFSWGVANTVSRRAGSINMLAYVVWASAFSIPPLVLMTLLLEGGWEVLSSTMMSASAGGWVGVLWQSWGNTLFGYTAWAWLLSKHPAAVVAPAPLLVPVFGMGTSAFFLGEALPLWKLGAAGLVITGLVINLFWPSLEAQIKKHT
ncbi:O-acetylserine/cysteine efflux transporter [Polynucleobacter meluiroseus]|uniref:O-acetylserine/cysteine efflux transporter n=1 Tax=Polynucleobacter meluiroseus TaxID=1938814 RepID=A0A240E3P0_9BURK|nr:EamA family transporter [Polynucleobacter meluiroseus]SNX29136.1 O-acetylserine/cysteine efflux transporter [Polynucleobacter meluiroseus]